MKYLTTVNDETYEIEILSDGEIRINGEARHVDFKSMGQHAIYSMIIDNQSFEALVEERDGTYHVMIFGDLYEVAVTDERSQRLALARGINTEQSGEVIVKSPMPGLIVAVPVHQGEVIVKGQTVIILESMKMQNELKAPRDGIITRVEVAEGDSVEQNKPLVVIS